MLSTYAAGCYAWLWRTLHLGLWALSPDYAVYYARLRHIANFKAHDRPPARQEDLWVGWCPNG